MADFTALKTAIQNAIKQNGNNAITGNLLQDILISMVSTLGDSAINGLSSSLSTETTNRQNADGALQSAINTINTKLSDGYTYLGIATPTTNPSTTSGKVFYIATTAATYTNFRNSSSQPLVLTQGINILKYNGTSWSVEQVWGVDDVPTAASNNLVKSGGVQKELALGAVYDVSAKNPTAGPNNDGKWESLSALLSDANLNTLIPTSVRKGGMSIKYVCSSDNKYVQWRYMGTDITGSPNPFLDINNWENLNNEIQNLSSWIPSFVFSKVSIIGDSISTFEGTMPSGYPSYYPARYVNSVKQTWWGQLIEVTHAELEVNASYAGSRVTEVSGVPSFYDRVNLIGSPQVIFVALGTNDYNHNVALGSYDYSTDTELLSESEFIPAYIKGVRGLMENYQSATIVLLAFSMGSAYKTAIQNIAKHYNLVFVDVSSYNTDNEVHPSIKGMRSVAYDIVNYFKGYLHEEIKDVGESISEELIKPFIINNAWILSSGHLVDYTANVFQICVKNGDKVRIIANNSNPTFYGLFTDNTIGSVAWGGRKNIQAGEEYTLIVDMDGYLIFCNEYNNDYSPAHIFINGIDCLANYSRQIINEVDTLKDNVNGVVYVLDERLSYRIVTDIWIEPGFSYLTSIKNYQGKNIKISPSKATRIAILTSKPVTGQQVVYSFGYENILINGDYEIFVPNDAEYLYVYAGNEQTIITCSILVPAIKQQIEEIENTFVVNPIVDGPIKFLNAGLRGEEIIYVVPNATTTQKTVNVSRDLFKPLPGGVVEYEVSSGYKILVIPYNEQYINVAGTGVYYSGSGKFKVDSPYFRLYVRKNDTTQIINPETDDYVVSIKAQLAYRRRFPYFLIAAADSDENYKRLADFICGEDARAGLQIAADIAYAYGTVLKVAEGNYYLKSTLDGGSTCISFSQEIEEVDTAQTGQSMQYSNRMQGRCIEGLIKPCSYNGSDRAATIHVHPDLLASVNSLTVIRTDEYAGQDWSTYFITSFLSLKNLIIKTHGNSKPVVGIDLQTAEGGSHLEGLRVIGLPDDYFKDWSAIPHQNSVGIISNPSATFNTNTKWSDIEINGFWKGVFFIGMEHALVENLTVQHCGYGMYFWGQNPHPITLINVQDEHNINLPFFGSSNCQITLRGYNACWPEDAPGYKTYDAESWATRKRATGNPRGEIVYTNNITRTGAINGPSLDYPTLFEHGQGLGIVVRNAHHQLSGTTDYRLSIDPNHLQQYYDTTLNKMVWCIDTENKVWVDADGTDVDA